MNLREFHALKVWCGQHARKPVERNVWDGVLTAWVLSLVGMPTAIVLHLGWAEGACFGVLFLPSLYVGLRRVLHRRHWLRCDWIDALR